MTSAAKSFGALLQTFFTDHLVAHRRVSPQTVSSYRDTFRLLLRFLHEKTGVAPSELRIEDLNATMILSFLDDLERCRGNCVRSRNVRLAAIRSFFRFAVFWVPESIAVATPVLAIPTKKADQKLVGYLTREEVEAILASPDRSTRLGRRDYAMFLTLYNSGARVSEMTALKPCQVAFGQRAFLLLHGKGRKEREIPLWRKTARTLKSWLQESPNDRVTVFPNARGGPLSSDGISYLLRKAVRRATVECPSLETKRVTPHILRHTTAMHLLQSGVDLAVIALWLGHESIETTHIYLEADLATKERALQSLATVGTSAQRFKADDSLMAFLATL